MNYAQDLIYLDSAATTKMSKRALETYKDCVENIFFNPSAAYDAALATKRAIDSARAEIGTALSAKKEEIIFTGSGTEADNLALFGCIKRRGEKILIGNLEHSAVHKSALELKSRGHDVTFIPVNARGRVTLEEFEKHLSRDTSLISVMHVNNETGCINDIEKMAASVKKICPQAIFHSDGIQAFLKIPTNVRQLGVDLYSISAHKIYGPKGVGALFVKKGISIKPMIFGGGQETGIRSGTENVAAIASFSEAIKEYAPLYPAETERQVNLLSYLRDAVLNAIPDALINTDVLSSAPHIFNFALKHVRGEVIVHALETHGIIVGTGSACAYAARGGDRVAKALGVTKDYADGFLRIGVSKDTNICAIDEFVAALTYEYKKLKR